MEDLEGKIWLAFEGHGLNFIEYDFNFVKGNKVLSNIRNKEILEKGDVSALLEHKTYVWAGVRKYPTNETELQTVLFKFNLKGDVIEEVPIKVWIDEYTDQRDQLIYHIYMDKENTIWLATGFGLVSVKKSNEKYFIQHFKYCEYNFHSLSPDPKQPEKYLWIGTSGGGLLLFNKETTSFSAIDIGKQHPVKKVSSVKTYNDQIWMGTEYGAYQLILKNKGGEIDHSVRLKTPISLTSDFTYYYGHNIEITPENELIFRGGNGFAFIDPNNLIKDNYKPLVCISDILINNKLAGFKIANSPLQKPIHLTRNLKLPYSQNTLSFELSSPVYHSNDQINYAFKLENYNNDWINNGPERTIHLSKIPPGKYVLKIKAANSEGLWSDPFSALKIRILRPWYASVIALICYFIIIVICGVLIVRAFLSRQRMRMSIELNRMEADKYKELDKLKSKFFANISHEFRTPLTLILSPIADLLDKVRIREDQEKLSMIENNANQLLVYITKILELSRLQAGNVQMNVEKINIEEFCRQIVAPFDSLIRQKKLRVNLNFSEEGIYWNLDAEKFQMILSNLLTNAFKFTPKAGEIDINIHRCRRNSHSDCNKESPCLIIKVRDTGIGISKQYLPHVFNQYFQIDHQGKSDKRGIGLGLSIVKELVNLHNGQIDVESEKGIYTLFTIRLPVLPVNSDATVKSDKHSLRSGFETINDSDSEEISEQSEAFVDDQFESID